MARAHSLHPLLRERYSPHAFDVNHHLQSEEISLLLEAARWAPSAGNSQPWAFVPARREEARHVMISKHLAPSSRRWAMDASALFVNIAHRFVEDSEIEFSEFSDYDLGQAVAHLTLQAQAMGLACRQFRAFDLEALSQQLQLVSGWHVVSMTAVGRAGEPMNHGRERRQLRALERDALTR